MKCTFVNKGVACEKVNVGVTPLCRVHVDLRCFICGRLVTHRCDDCDKTLCSSDNCKLTHAYMAHHNRAEYIAELEEKTGCTPAVILIGRMATMPSIPNPAYKIGYLIPMKGGGCIWTNIHMGKTMEEVEAHIPNPTKSQILCTELILGTMIQGNILKEII